MRAMRYTSFAAALTVSFFFLFTGCSQGPSNPSSSPAADSAAAAAPTEAAGAEKAQPGVASVEFSSSQYSASQAAGSVSLTVERTGPATSAANVVYGTVADTGTAVANSDYTFVKGELSWAENDSTPRTISVPVSKATPFSGSKSFRVQLWAPSDGLAVATPGSATVTITGDASDSAGTLKLGATSYTVSQSAGHLTVGVTRTGGAIGDVGVNYATTNQTMPSGGDYTPMSGTLQWANGDASTKTISIPISDATPFSGSKTFAIALSDATGGAALSTPSAATVSVTGASSPPAGSVHLSGSSYVVGQSAGSLTVTVDRVSGTNGAIAVSYDTHNSTAVASTDYMPTLGTLRWADGDSSPKTFTVPISNATPFAGNKTFGITLSDATAGAAITSPGIATATISGDQAPGSLALAAASASIAQGGGSLTVTVDRTGGTNGAVTVAYATSNGTAVAGADYSATSGTLTWASGDGASKTFSVPVSDATPFSGDKSFAITLSGATGGATMGAPSSMTATIVGTAAAAPGSPQLSSSSYTVLQSAGSVSVTVNRSGGSSGAFSVAYATANGTAVAGTDYTATSGTLEWQSGDAASQSFTVPVSNGSPFVGTKAFKVSLSTPSNGIALGNPSAATVTIDGSASGGSGPGAPANLLMTGQTTSSISLSWSAGSAGAYPVASYRVYRNGSLYATVAGTTYTDAAASNATVPSFTQNATIYSYAVTAVDTKGNESTQAYPSVWFYHNGVATQGAVDYSYGITENWRDTAGIPAAGTYDVSLMYPNGGGFQPFTNVPLAPVYDLELGSFKYLTLDVKVTQSNNYPFFVSHISRLPPGDVYPRQYVNLFSYCTPVVNQWVTCKIPLSDLSIGFTNFTASISGNQLTVTSIQSGVGVDAGGFISGPGIPANTYIVSPPGGVTYNNGLPPSQNLLGSYTIAGPGVTSSLSVQSEGMSEQRTALYKVDVGLRSIGTATTIYLDNLGWTTN
jgi:Calx-beta domain